MLEAIGLAFPNLDTLDLCDFDHNTITFRKKARRNRKKNNKLMKAMCFYNGFNLLSSQ